MSRTLSGLFLVGAVNRPRKRKRTNRENPRRVPGQIGKIPEKSQILGPSNGCPNFMGAWKNAFSLQEKPMPIKFRVLGGGVFWVLGGGGRFYLYGREDFSEKRTKKDKKGRTSPDREAPPFETPPV